MPRMIAFAALLALGLSTAAAHAQQPLPVAGADDPAFRGLLATWLDGDDAGSLPGLATLANDGNTAAQLLLGRMDQHGMTATPWVDSLSRDERNAIFRHPDGRFGFGTSWITLAANEGSPLAIAFTPREIDANYNADDALALAALGEPRATLWHLDTLYNQGLWAEVLRLETVAATYDMDWMAWAAATFLPGPEAEVYRAKGLQALAAGTMDGYAFIIGANPELTRRFIDLEVFSIAVAVLDGRNLYLEDSRPQAAVATLDRWLAQADGAQLLRRWCAAACQDVAAECASDIYALTGGRHVQPYVSASPIETLVPQDMWIDTPRALLALEHYALARVNYAASPDEALAALPVAACVKNGLSASVVAR